MDIFRRYWEQRNKRSPSTSVATANGEHVRNNDTDTQHQLTTALNLDLNSPEKLIVDPTIMEVHGGRVSKSDHSTTNIMGDDNNETAKFNTDNQQQQQQQQQQCNLGASQNNDNDGMQQSCVINQSHRYQQQLIPTTARLNTNARTRSTNTNTITVSSTTTTSSSTTTIDVTGKKAAVEAAATLNDVPKNDNGVPLSLTASTIMSKNLAELRSDINDDANTIKGMTMTTGGDSGDGKIASNATAAAKNEVSNCVKDAGLSRINRIRSIHGNAKTTNAVATTSTTATTDVATDTTINHTATATNTNTNTNNNTSNNNNKFKKSSASKTTATSTNNNLSTAPFDPALMSRKRVTFEAEKDTKPQTNELFSRKTNNLITRGVSMHHNLSKIKVVSLTGTMFSTKKMDVLVDGSSITGKIQMGKNNNEYDGKRSTSSKAGTTDISAVARQLKKLGSHNALGNSEGFSTIRPKRVQKIPRNFRLGDTNKDFAQSREHTSVPLDLTVAISSPTPSRKNCIDNISRDEDIVVTENGKYPRGRRARSTQSVNNGTSINQSTACPGFEDRKVAANFDAVSSSYILQVNKESGKETNELLVSSRQKSTVVNGRWTEEEHNRFVQGLILFGTDWGEITKIVKSRSAKQVLAYSRNANRGMTLGHWSLKDYKILGKIAPKSWSTGSYFSKEDILKKLQSKERRQTAKVIPSFPSSPVLNNINERKETTLKIPSIRQNNNDDSSKKKDSIQAAISKPRESENDKSQQLLIKSKQEGSEKTKETSSIVTDHAFVDVSHIDSMLLFSNKNNAGREDIAATNTTPICNEIEPKTNIFSDSYFDINGVECKMCKIKRLGIRKKIAHDVFCPRSRFYKELLPKSIDSGNEMLISNNSCTIEPTIAELPDTVRSSSGVNNNPKFPLPDTATSSFEVNDNPKFPKALRELASFNEPSKTEKFKDTEIKITAGGRIHPKRNRVRNEFFDPTTIPGHEQKHIHRNKQSFGEYDDDVEEYDECDSGIETDPTSNKRQKHLSSRHNKLSAKKKTRVRCLNNFTVSKDTTRRIITNALIRYQLQDRNNKNRSRFP